MRILAIVFGAVLLIVAVRGTEKDSVNGNGDGKGLWPLLKTDFESSDKGNFVAWFAAIFIVGALGYIDSLKPIANSMLALLILVLFLANGNAKSGGGFFEMLKEAVALKPGQAA